MSNPVNDDDELVVVYDGEMPVNEAAFGITVAGADNQVIPTGRAFQFEVPYDCKIIGWTILEADGIVGSIVVDVRRSGYLDYPAFVSIAGTEKPSLTSATKNRATALTTWTENIAKGDIIAGYVESVSAIKEVFLSISVIKY